MNDNELNELAHECAEDIGVREGGYGDMVKIICGYIKDAYETGKEETMKKKKHAGGRPKILRERVKISVTLDRSHVDAIDRMSAANRSNRSEALREIIEYWQGC